MRFSPHVFINWAIEFGPILVFFTMLFLEGERAGGFVRATGVFVLLTTLALLVAYAKDGRIALFPLIAGTFIIGFGVLTVLYDNPFIFIIKDTFYNGAFALALFIGIVRNKGLLKHLFGSLFDITDRGWYILSFRWASMFFILTISNELVWRHFSEQAWVFYKFLATIVTALFGIYQVRLARRERNATASAWGLRLHASEDPIVLIP